MAHVIIDGGLNGDRIKKRISNFEEVFGKNGLIELNEVANAYEYLYKQNKHAWTFELDLRTSKEKYFLRSPINNINKINIP